MKSVNSLMKFPKDQNTLETKCVTSLMKFPKDQNTLTMKSVNSLMKFSKDQNIHTNNLKNVNSLMKKVDSYSVSGKQMEGPTDLIVGLSLHTHGISHELVVGSMKM